MDSRQRMLRAIDLASAPDEDPPALAGPWTRYEDREAAFCAMVEAASGEVVRVASDTGLAAAIARHPSFAPPSVVHSFHAACPRRDVGADPGDPRSLAADLVIAKGEFGVAENGAVWVVPGSLVQRRMMFLAEHVALVVPARELVDNTADAYDRIAASLASAGAPPYGVFVSGPSKTADIEQALVTGAHGPRTTTVYLVGG